MRNLVIGEEFVKELVEEYFRTTPLRVNIEELYRTKSHFLCDSYKLSAAPGKAAAEDLH